MLNQMIVGNQTNEELMKDIVLILSKITINPFKQYTFLMYLIVLEEVL